MKAQRSGRIGLVLALATLGVSCGLGAAVAAPPVPEAGREGMQVLTRGPVHEAFAETVAFDPEPGLVVPKMPPDAIEEVPPAHKPEGANVAWIPGYWAWDDDTSDFLWVSGIWRSLPPGREWVPGYWVKSGGGAQWISGYWADVAQTETEYLPEPPASVEAGPNTEAPSADYSWLPGGWVWQQNRYAWRPGFWSPMQKNWDWTPAHYQWSPRGYVYVDGYWDYAVDRRGVLFAPVRISQSAYSQQGFSYTPATVINLGMLASQLFLRPNYGHYYYGDYYGANYATAGFLPSYSYGSGRHGYDPIYSRQRFDHREDRNWEQRVQADFQNRQDHEDARPPRTFAAQQELGRKGLTGREQGRVFAQPLDQFTKSKDGPMRFQPVNAEDRERFGRVGQEARTHRDARQKLETSATKPVEPAAGRPAVPFEPSRAKLPRSPFAAKGPEQFGKDEGPPKTHEFPKLDPKVVAKPRQPMGQVKAPQVGPRPGTPPLQPNPTPRANPVPTPKAEPKGPQERPKVGPPEKPKGGPNLPR